MKKSIVGGVLLGVSLGSLAWFIVPQKTAEPIYTPRTVAHRSSESAKGSAEWLHRLRANQETGEINTADVLAARAALAQEQRFKQSGVLNLVWEERGPDNYGGRTRALYIDPSNPQFMLTGSVSGGLFRSVNGGSSWQIVDNDAPNNAVTSVIRAANGDLYYGTGEGMHYFASGSGTGGIIGGGVFKSTDNGQTFTSLTATVPQPNSNSTDWAAISFLGADPNNGQRIYAATNRGLRRTDDGGATWVNPITGGSGVGQATDMTVSPSGAVWMKLGAAVWYSATGDDGSFAVVGGGLPPNGGRSRIAVSPTNEDVVFVCNVTGGGGLGTIYQTKDRGQSWNLVAQGTSNFNPMNNQGDYDLLLTVDPKDEDRIIVGGVELWEWSATGGWVQIHSRFDSPNNPFYVHVDQHECVFHPTNPNILYVTNDGGIFRSSNNGFTWDRVNNNYISLQLYSAFGNDQGQFLGGSQDNGTIGILGTGNTPKAGVRTPGINYQVTANSTSSLDGDGGYVAVSQLNPNMLFKEMQYGILGRSFTGGEIFSAFYDFPRMDPTYISGGITAAFSEFVTPFELWESYDDPFSIDSVYFKAEKAVEALGFAAPSDTASRGVIALPQPVASFIVPSFKVTHGPLVLTSDASGNLTGDGSGSFNPSTGEFVARFNQYFALEVIATCDVRYDAGDVIGVRSLINENGFNYTVAQTLVSGDSVRIQDPQQSIFAIGLRSRTLSGQSQLYGGLWITRRAHDISTDRPEWFQIYTPTAGNSITAIAIAEDGNTIFCGVSNGQLIRISNLSNSRDYASCDVQSATRTTTQATAGQWSNRTITDIAIDPNNPNRVLVTLGNYGNTTNVFFSSNALSATPTFTSRQGNLPSMPCYSGMLHIFDGAVALVGTDYGVFSTDNINSTSPVWTKEDNGLADVPVFSIHQANNKRLSWNGDTLYSGTITLGTHGRGFVQTTSLRQPNAFSTPEVPLVQKAEEGLKLFPNPAKDHCSVELALASRTNVFLSVIDLNGRVVRQVELKGLSAGAHRLPIDVAGLSAGVYVVKAEAGSLKKTGRLVVR